MKRLISRNRRSRCCRAPIKFESYTQKPWYCMMCEERLSVGDTAYIWPTRDKWSDFLDIMRP